MAPNKLVKTTRPTPRRAHTDPAAHSISPLPSLGSDDALIESLQRTRVFNHSNLEIRRTARRIPSVAGSQMRIQHTYPPTHVQRPSPLQERMEIQAVEEGWQIVRVFRVDPEANAEGSSRREHESTSEWTALRSSAFTENARGPRQPNVFQTDEHTSISHAQQRASRADTMFDLSKKGWRALTNTPEDAESGVARPDLHKHARNALGIPSGTYFVEDLPECQWAQNETESGDAHDLKSLAWIVPALTTT